MNAEKSPVNHNVDHEEIAKFEAVASRWWDLEGEFKPLHRINPLRLSYIAERAGGLFGKKVLDVGCGGGILAESMAREGATVTGLDMGFEPLQVAKLHARPRSSVSGQSLCATGETGRRCLFLDAQPQRQVMADGGGWC